MNSVVRFAGTDTTRKPSDTVWKQCPWAAIQNGNVNGAVFFEDFLSWPLTIPTTEGNWGQWTAFSVATPLLAGNPATPTQGGEFAMGCAANDNDAFVLRTVAVPFFLSRDFGDFWYEIRIKKSTIADTKHNVFVGLMENVAGGLTIPITAAGALADKNLVGFRGTETSLKGAFMSTVYKADGVTAVDVQADAVTLVADTYTKLGMHYTRNGDKDGSYRLSFYQDGVRLTTSKQIPSAAGTDFPNDISLGLVIGIQNATGTSPGSSCIDWVRAAQTY